MLEVETELIPTLKPIANRILTQHRMPQMYLNSQQIISFGCYDSVTSAYFKGAEINCCLILEYRTIIILAILCQGQVPNRHPTLSAAILASLICTVYSVCRRLSMPYTSDLFIIY